MKALSILDNQIDELISCLDQIDALLTVATTVDTSELKPEIALNYLYATNNIIANARSICEQLASFTIG